MYQNTKASILSGEVREKPVSDNIATEAFSKGIVTKDFPQSGNGFGGIPCQLYGYDSSLDYGKYPTVVWIPPGIKRNHLTNRDEVNPDVHKNRFSRREHGSLPAPEGVRSADFKVRDDILIQYNGASSDPMVPDGVRIIEEYAFAENKTIRTVTLPDTVIQIKQNAFYGCENLQTVNFPTNLEMIGDRAFMYSGLRNAVLPDSLKQLGDAAFCRTQIDRIRIPPKVTVVPKAAFEFCCLLREVELCEGVAAIDAGAFHRCKNLKTVIIPDSLKQVRGIQFVGTDQISSVIAGSEWKAKNTQIMRMMMPSDCEADNFLIEGGVLVRYFGRAIRPGIPAGVREIGKEAFALNSHIHSIIIPEGVRTIAQQAFAGCGNLGKVSMPQTLVRIGEKAFECTGLTSVEIPQNVYGIGMHAFGNCDQLAEITLPEGLMSVPVSAFENCRKLRKIHASEGWEKKNTKLISAILDKHG